MTSRQYIRYRSTICPACGGTATERGSYGCGVVPRIERTPLGSRYLWHDEELPGPPAGWCVHVLSCDNCNWTIRQEGRYDPRPRSGG